jgi:FG-GAP-like repeat/FG-GAP repeat
LFSSFRSAALVAVLLLAAATGLIVAASLWRFLRQPPNADDAFPLLWVPFEHVVIDDTPSTGPQCCTDVLATGDINGDGLPDVVLGAQESPGAGLVWYEAPGWRRHEVGRGEFTTDGQVADVNLDGDADIVVGELMNGLTWYENTGRGEAWIPHVIGAGYVHDVLPGDLYGDGRLEVVVCDKKEVSLWYQNPSGWARQLLLAEPGEGVAVADIDADSDLDVVFGRRWLENPSSPGRPWNVHVIASAWPGDTRVRVADMNGDARADVILTASEGAGRIAWFEQPLDATAWPEHPIADMRLDGVHSLVVDDLDGDADLDVAVAEMHTSARKRVLVFVNDGGDLWRTQTLASTGSHNMQAADIDGDGDIDLVGKNYGGKGRTLEAWMNLTRDNFDEVLPAAVPFFAHGWRYVAIDTRRDEDQRGKFGLLSADVNVDGWRDVVAGSFAYLNPGHELAEPWQRIRIGSDVDVIAAIDVDGDEYCDLVGTRGASLLWLEARSGNASSWSERLVATIPDARTQGYVTADLDRDGREEVVFTRGTTLLAIRIPARPDAEEWPRVIISETAEEEGVAAADLDRDGDLDVVGIEKGGASVFWFENRDAGGSWRSLRIGSHDGGKKWLDRVAVADVNLDGRIDVLVTEETQDWHYNANLFWFEAPVDPVAGEWRRHRIAVLRSANSLDVRDIDGDGDADVVTAEHTDMGAASGAPNNLTTIFENVDRGQRWRSHPIEVGPHSSHLGARVFDLDGRATPEIVSLGWNQYQTLHLWWPLP